jgi:hypothetical protein
MIKFNDAQVRVKAELVEKGWLYNEENGRWQRVQQQDETEEEAYTAIATDLFIAYFNYMNSENIGEIDKRDDMAWALVKESLSEEEVKVNLNLLKQLRPKGDEE